MNSSFANLPSFPDRFDALKQLANGKLGEVVVGVEESLNHLEYLYIDMVAAGRGGFLIFRGESGSGKSTFLRTIHLFISSIEEPFVIAAEQRSIPEFLSKLIPPREDRLRIVVIEDREALKDISEVELETSLHGINRFIRSVDGLRTLVVWQCNTDDLEARLINLARSLGGEALLGMEDPSYLFTGPAKSRFLEIGDRTLRALNAGVTRTDIGISEERAQDLVQKAPTIGFYLGLLRREAIQNQREMVSLLRNQRYHVWIVVIAGNDPKDAVRILTRGRGSTADIERLLGETEANITKKLQKYTHRVGILSMMLDFRIIWLPCSLALNLSAVYGSEILQAELDKLGIKPKKNSNLSPQLLESDLAKAFLSQPTLQRSRSPNPKPELQTQFDQLLKIVEHQDQLLNQALGRSLQEHQLIASYQPEHKFGNHLEIQTDLCCATVAGTQHLEVMWRRSTSGAEIADYSLRKLYSYGQAIGLLELA
jgi:energy-coupling factor transporter ATP-binding protein EcfA2